MSRGVGLKVRVGWGGDVWGVWGDNGVVRSLGGWVVKVGCGSYCPRIRKAGLYSLLISLLVFLKPDRYQFLSI